MVEQSYEKHTQKVPFFGSMLLLLMAAFAGACVGLYYTHGNRAAFHTTILLTIVIVATLGGLAACRGMALKVQDRAIRAEENLRHYVLTGKLLDKRLTMKQIVAVRFASDDQFPELARQAADQGMAADAIKRAVRNWRPDFDRA